MMKVPQKGSFKRNVLYRAFSETSLHAESFNNSLRCPTEVWTYCEFPRQPASHSSIECQRSLLLSFRIHQNVE